MIEVNFELMPIKRGTMILSGLDIRDGPMNGIFEA